MKIYPILTSIALAASFALGGCTTPAPTQTLPQITFAHLVPLEFDVEKVEVDNRYKAPNDPSYIEDRFPTPPASAIRIWAIERLKPVGAAGSGTLRVVIKRASVQEEKLDIDKGIKGAFTKEQSNRYTLMIDADVVILDSVGKQVGFSSAKASRSTTTREDISLNDREKQWFEMTEKTMGDFNTEMESNIRQYLAKYLR